MVYRAKLLRSRSIVIAGAVFTALTLWAIRHVITLAEIRHGHNSTFTFIYFVSFVLLVWQTILYSLEKPYKTTMYQQDKLDKMRVIVNVPVCNEDVTALKQCLLSLLRQSRPVDVIHVVVNGPNKVDYSQLEREAVAAGKGKVVWITQAIAGKRQAQARTVTEYLQPNDIFLTVDSDAYLDSEAVAEGLKPLADKRVMSVAGIVLTTNNRAKLLTRLSDLWFLVGQLVDRSAFSTMGSVLVNSGVLAFYRGHILIDNLDAYTHETFFGHPVEFSDDSMLTIYALQQGRTVQQPTSFSFTLMPEKMSHHFRQQVRWMRGAFIRSWWRFKYLPLNGYAFWGHLIGWAQLFMSLGVFAYLFIYMPAIDHVLLPYLLVIPVLVGYGQGLRYLTVWRSDESFMYRFTTYLMQPIPALWTYFVLRFVRYYAIATCLRTGWGTRQDVEVTA